MKQNLLKILTLLLIGTFPIFQSCSSSSTERPSVEGEWKTDVMHISAVGEVTEKQQTQIDGYNRELNKYFFVRTVDQKEFRQDAYRLNQMDPTQEPKLLTSFSFDYTLTGDTIYFDIKGVVGDERKAHCIITNGINVDGELTTKEVMDYNGVNFLMMKQLLNGVTVSKDMQDIEFVFKTNELK